MAYGTLEVSCGPMWSGKTTESLKKALINRTLFNKRVFVFKPAFDDRYSTIEIISHDGLKTEAHSVNNEDQIFGIVILANAFAKANDMIIFDEIQFFMPPYFEGDMVKIVRYFLNAGLDVFCAGLDMDWKGNPFEVTGKMLAMADKITKLKANCFVSGLPAGKTYKLSQGGGSVELGATNKYEARCNQHWSLPEDVV